MTSTEWVHERFASLLGFSEDTSVEFVLMIGILIIPWFSLTFQNIAQKAKTSDEIFKALTDFGFPPSGETRSFGFELFEKYSIFFKDKKVILIDAQFIYRHF